MSLRLGPPYVNDAPARVPSPVWHRLPSTAWLGADVLFTALCSVCLVSGAWSAWAMLAGPLGILAAVVCAITTFIEIGKYPRPVASLINLPLSLLLNPYAVAGYLVYLGVLDFG